MSLKYLVLPWLLAGCVFAPLLQAQQAQWQNLTQIRRGVRVQVVENSLKSTSGTFIAFSETDLTLEVEGKEVVVPKNQVHRVTISGKNRKRNVLIGLAIGAGAGAGLGAATNRVVGDAAVIPGMAGVFAGIGAGVGALCPAAKTVYRAELPAQTAREKVAASKTPN